jgi:hypothetical protein
MVRQVAVALVVSIASVSGSPAADYPVLGKTFAVSAGNRPTIKGLGKQSAPGFPQFADPRIGGASLTVIANGGMPTSQNYALDASGWRQVGSGFKYAGPTGADGDPVKKVVMTKSQSGRVRLSIVVVDGTGSQPVTVTPPNPGSDGGFIVDVAGDRYCVKLGGTAGGTERKDDAEQWRVTNAVAADACPTADGPPTTCGNNSIEPPETCDGTTSSCVTGMPPFYACVDCQCCGIAERPCYAGTCCSSEYACVPTRVGGACARKCTTSADCTGERAPPICEDGRCCAGIGGTCETPQLAIYIPCCSNLVCARPSPPGSVSYLTCCVPAGGACAAGADCCSDSCNPIGSTCD